MKTYYKIAIIGAITTLAACQQFPNTHPNTGSGYQTMQPSSVAVVVRQALMNNNQLAGLPIQVDVEQNVVQLNGYVKTIRQSDVAGDVASKVPGVQGVQNNLIVRK